MHAKTVISFLSAALLVSAPAFSRQPDPRPATSSSSTAMDTRAQSRTILGTVKAYEAGKKLAVLNSDQILEVFRLDDDKTTAKINPSVAVGMEVKVLETMKDGQRTLTVEPLRKM